MATIKVKFRSSSVDAKEGTLFYQVIHNRVARQIKTGYRLFEKEWDSKAGTVLFLSSDKQRMHYLLGIDGKVSGDVTRLKRVVAILDRGGKTYTADDVVAIYLKQIEDTGTFFSYMKKVVAESKELGKVRLSETYMATFNSFVRFREGRDLLPDEIDSAMMLSYEAYLKEEGVTKNTSSFYMRNLRAVYNRMLENEDIILPRNPFKHVYTGIDKTVKRAIPIKELRRIKEMKLGIYPCLEYARDMFLFSFYTRGMSFVDMAYLKKKNLQNGMLFYRRKKTGQQLAIRWEDCMQEIVEKYQVESSPYLLPIIRIPEENERKQYESAGHLVNRKLKLIGKRLGLTIPLTMYVARHSWASVAKSKNVPLSVISEGMGHDSEVTTQIYLASLDTTHIDKANKLILSSLQKK